jgi:hypothetical protein
LPIAMFNIIPSHCCHEYYPLCYGLVICIILNSY